MDYHSMFVTLTTLFNVMDREKVSWWMYISTVSMIIEGIVTTTLMFISVVHYVQIFDIYLLTEAGTYLLLKIFQLIITYCIATGKKRYHNLLQAMREDFHYIFSTQGQKHREKFFENQLLTFRGCVIAIVMTLCTAGGMALCFCIAVVIKTQKGSDERLLPFPFWIFDKDLLVTPIYELLLVVSVLMLSLYSYLYIFMMISYAIWIREITCKADIITWNLQDLLVDVLPAKSNEEKDYYAALVKHRMREIIKMHHAMNMLLEDFAAVFKTCLFFEQIIAPVVICMTAYCFTSKLKKGEIEVFLLVLSIGSAAVVFVPNYLCTHLLEKVQSVGDACWDMPFWNAEPAIRPYLVLIMQRSMRPLPIAAAGFSNVSLQTYSNTLTRAYSCFNMLRQAELD